MGKGQDEIFDKLWDYLTPKRKELLCRILENRTEYFTIAIDDVKKEHNSGALIRTCESFGIHEVSIVDPEFRRRSVRNTSKGSAKWVEQRIFDSWHGEDGCIRDLRRRGYQIVATAPTDRGVFLEDFRPKAPTAFLFGNEAEGLDAKIIEAADEVLSIRTEGFSESLNVSVSAGILLYSVMKRIKPSLPSGFFLSPEKKQRTLLDWTVKSIPRGESIMKKLTQEAS